jgi:hypothetical protein
MPADHRLWFDDGDRTQHSWNQPVKPDEHRAIDAAQAHRSRVSAAQHIELMTQHDDLSPQLFPRAKAVTHIYKDKSEQPDHLAGSSSDTQMARESRTDRINGRDSGSSSAMECLRINRTPQLMPEV